MGISPFLLSEVTVKTGTKFRRLTIEKKLLQFLASEGGSTNCTTSQLATEIGVGVHSLEMAIHRMYVAGVLVRRDKEHTLRVAAPSPIAA